MFSHLMSLWQIPLICIAFRPKINYSKNCTEMLSGNGVPGICVTKSNKVSFYANSSAIKSTYFSYPFGFLIVPYPYSIHLSKFGCYTALVACTSVIKSSCDYWFKSLRILIATFMLVYMSKASLTLAVPPSARCLISTYLSFKTFFLLRISWRLDDILVFITILILIVITKIYLMML